MVFNERCVVRIRLRIRTLADLHNALLTRPRRDSRFKMLETIARFQ